MSCGFQRAPDARATRAGLRGPSLPRVRGARSSGAAAARAGLGLLRPRVLRVLEGGPERASPGPEKRWAPPRAGCGGLTPGDVARAAPRTVGALRRARTTSSVSQCCLGCPVWSLVSFGVPARVRRSARTQGALAQGRRGPRGSLSCQSVGTARLPVPGQPARDIAAGPPVPRRALLTPRSHVQEMACPHGVPRGQSPALRASWSRGRSCGGLGSGRP